MIALLYLPLSLHKVKKYKREESHFLYREYTSPRKLERYNNKYWRKRWLRPRSMNLASYTAAADGNVARSPNSSDTEEITITVHSQRSPNHGQPIFHSNKYGETTQTSHPSTRRNPKEDHAKQRKMVKFRPHILARQATIQPPPPSTIIHYVSKFPMRWWQRPWKMLR